jgi:peptidoglycan/xylan/chitin deacetylase (PgdA/CDA1 family)
MKMRRVKNALLNTAERTGILRLAQIPLHETGNHLFVLAYHRVAEPDNLLSNHLYDLVCASPRKFDEQMRLISTCFHPVSAEDVLNALSGGRQLPAQAVLVTVDDGYIDFKESIYPITEKYGIHPILFVSTAYVGGGIFWWDRLFNAINNTKLQEVETPFGWFSLHDKASRLVAFDTLADSVRMQPFEKAFIDIEQLCDRITPDTSPNIPYTLNWDDLRTLSINGVTIASHTHNHPILTHIPIEKARDEIRISLDLIKQQIGQPLPIFAYPDGRDHAVSKDLAFMLREEGIQIAFTMSDRISSFKRDDPQLFPRLIPHHSITLAQFHLRLTALRAAKN